MILNHSPARILRTLLIAKDGGTDHLLNDRWPIFVSLEPDNPDDIITIYNTVGNQFGRIQISGETVEHAGIQVALRCSDSEEGLAKAREIEWLLNEDVYREEVSMYDQDDILWDYLLHSATQRSLILPLGKMLENSKRYLFTINYTVTVTVLS